MAQVFLMELIKLPQRSNEFQELVTLIQHAFSPMDAKITESAMVPVNGLSEMREVDVLIEGEYSTFQLKIAVEAKDERRPFTLPALESIIAKYRGECRVLVDKIVVVTRNGFTKGAKEKAMNSGVELLTLDEASGKNWADMKPAIAHYKSSPHVCGIQASPPIPGIGRKQFRKEGVVLCKCCKREIDLLENWVRKVVFDPNKTDLANYLKSLDKEAEDQGESKKAIGISFKNYLVKVGNEIYEISDVHVLLHAVHALGTSKCKTYDYTSSSGERKSLNHVRMEAAGRFAEILFPDGLNSKKVSVRIGKLDSKPDTKLKNRNGRNAACPCGSGRKHKHCCGNLDRDKNVD